MVALSLHYDDRWAMDPTILVKVKRKVSVSAGRSGIVRSWSGDPFLNGAHAPVGQVRTAHLERHGLGSDTVT